MSFSCHLLARTIMHFEILYICMYIVCHLYTYNIILMLYRRQVVPLRRLPSPPVYTQQIPQLPASGKVLRIMLYIFTNPYTVPFSNLHLSPDLSLRDQLFSMVQIWNSWSLRYIILLRAVYKFTLIYIY